MVGLFSGERAMGKAFLEKPTNGLIPGFFNKVLRLVAAETQTSYIVFFHF